MAPSARLPVILLWHMHQPQYRDALTGQYVLPWTYLHDSGVEWEGLRVWGTPWQPWFFDWAFNGRPEQLQRQWALIPEGTDILLVHGPPHGYGDGVPERAGIRHCGCPHLLERILQIRPRLAVYGHIHEDRGEWQLGPTRLANVTGLTITSEGHSRTARAIGIAERTPKARAS